MAVRPLNALSFCSGIAGLELGVSRALQGGLDTLCYVESELYCVAVLVARMQDGRLSKAPIWSDIRTFDPEPWRGCVDLITAGFPCSPFSEAGARQGATDPRHVWPSILAHVHAVRPRVLFCENVPGLLTLGFDQICQDLCAIHYRVEAGLFSAAEVGAPHLRKRLFFIAYDDADSLTELQLVADNKAMADANYRRDARRPETMLRNGQSEPGGSGDEELPARDRPAERRLGIGYDGLPRELDAALWGENWERGLSRIVKAQPHRKDRLRALGNAVVPAVAEHAFATLITRAREAER